MVNKNEILLDLYQDAKDPNSYGSRPIQGLLQNAKKILPSIKRDDIVKFLKSQKAYSLLYIELQIKDSYVEEY